MRKFAIASMAAVVAGAGLQAQAQAQPTPAPQVDRTVLPISPGPFKGSIGLTGPESTPYFPADVRAPAGAPNVVLILLDDLGFGASSPFGGAIGTPTLQGLADQGLRYNRFHVTALCTPTRAALLTGRNHHSVHSGVVTELSTGYPGYDSLMSKDTATIAETLKLNGYNTAWFGKNHNVPDWHTSAAGPFDRWPGGLGFEKFYGFLGGEANQFRPALYDGTTPIDPYVGKPDYHLDYDLADQAISWIRMQKTVAPQKPFFVYYAPGAMHAPQQPKKEWIAKYKGKFDRGWDVLREETFARQKALGVIPADAKLTPRPDVIPSWDSLTPDQKRISAYMMEIAAGQLEEADYNIGRIMSSIDELGQRENTLVVYIVGDNGGAASFLNGTSNDITLLSGVMESYEDVAKRRADLATWKSNTLFPAPWAWAMNTPFQWAKGVASHFGGTRNGMVMSWPAGIKAKGELRTQFHHVIDIAPTILEAAHLPEPVSVDGVAQKPIEGVSMAYSFNNAKAPDRRTTQYFEIRGNVAIYNEGWVAATTPTRAPWETGGNEMNLVSDKWELYNIDKDYSEADDLALKMPGKLKEMQIRFFSEAARYNILPYQTSGISRFGGNNRPSLADGRTSFTYYDGLRRIPEGSAPNTKNRSWRLTSSISTSGRDSGVIATLGGLPGGWSLYLDKGRPVFSYRFADGTNYRVASSKPVPSGNHSLVMDFAYDGGGTGKGGVATLRVDNVVYASGRVEKTAPFRFTVDETLDIGEDTGTPVDLAYDVPFAFTGNLGKVVIDLK